MTRPPGDDRFWLPRHTRREFRERMEAGELRACIVPVGAIEQHLEHLAMDHDCRSSQHIAVEVARQLDPHVIVAPYLSIGISEHHMRHPGTLTAMPGSWMSVLFDGLRSLHDAGFRHLLVLNGHGGNVAPSEGCWSQLQQRLECNLLFRSYWELLPPEEANPHLQTDLFPGHAQEFETAFALAAFPENVRTDMLEETGDPGPSAATADAGRRLIERIVHHTTSLVRDMIEGRLTADIPDFF